MIQYTVRHVDVDCSDYGQASRRKLDTSLPGSELAGDKSLPGARVS